MIEMRKVTSGMLEFANRELLPKLDPTRQFFAGAVLGLMSGRLEAVAGELAKNPLVNTLGIVQGNMVDLDAIYSALSAQFGKQPVLPVNIPMLGQYNFNAADATLLYQIISGMP
jgi:hypothetical protein